MEKKERKSNLITARLSDTDIDILNDLSEYTNKTKSDTILRACKFWSNTGDIVSDDENEVWGKVHKQNRVHVRVNNSDMNMINESCNRLGISLSQFVRRSVRAYERSIKGYY